MKYIVMSDAHGNLYYLEKCIETMHSLAAWDGSATKIYLGDVFGYGSNGAECYELLQQEGFTCLLGNHEAMILGQLPIDPEKNKLYRLNVSDNKVFSGQMKSCIEINGNSRLLFVHGSPEDPLNGYLYEEDVDGITDRLPYDYVFMGHTHRPFIKEHLGTRYVNVGSCGLPRDIGNQPSFVIYDDEQENCELIRIMIDKGYIEEHYQDVHPDVRRCLLRNTD